MSLANSASGSSSGSPANAARIKPTSGRPFMMGMAASISPAIQQEKCGGVNLLCEYFWSVLRHHYRMFEMGGVGAVAGSIGMAVFVDEKFSGAERHHRLYRDDEPFDELLPFSFLSKIRHVRLFVYFCANAVSRQIAGKAKMVFIGNSLYCISNIASCVSDARLCDSRSERLFRSLN